MRRYLGLALGVLVFAIAAPASAFGTRVIFDPPPSTTNFTLSSIATPGCTSSTPCNILLLDHTYQVDFLPCSQITSVDASGYSYCLWMNNVTGYSANTFTFDFIVPTGGGPSGGLTCGTQGLPPGTVAVIDCPSPMPAVGDPFPVSFHINPPLSNNSDFYLFTNFFNTPDTANVTVSNGSVSVPEPGELGLFGVGLLVLGAGYGLQRRRRKPQANDAA